GAALPGFLDPPLDLREIEIIGPPAQILAELALREGAELTAEIADVGVVDVAGDDIADRVAIDPTAEPVGGVADGGEAFAARGEELDDIGFAKRFASRSAVEQGRQLPLTLPLRGPLPLPAEAGRGAFGCVLPRPACRERAGVRGNHNWRLGSGAGDPIVGAREP